MCGLVGYLIKNSKFEANNSTIKEMLMLQKHRGPDDSGIVAINSTLKRTDEIASDKEVTFEQPCNIVFGFNRLSILDLSINGHQPMSSFDKKVVLMLNGEVYNAFDFKEELIKRGAKFKSNTDTEVVLNLYLTFGIEGMLQRLNGMFAISIWDANVNKLYLIRDRFGIKPLYILDEPNRIAFSSEIKSFKALPNFKLELNKDYLHEFLLFRNLVNNTLFKNIRNLKPGTYLEINEDGTCKENCYYSLAQDGNNENKDSHALKDLEEALRKSVQSQMLSHVKLGCQLSGGVDSSLVTAFAQGFNREQKLETISILFRDKKYSEEEYIDKVTNHFKLHSHKYYIDADYYFQMIEKATWHFEQPINHPNTIALYLLSEKAKQHVTVLLSGEGADETLGGYSRFIDYQNNPYLSKSFLAKLYYNRKNIVDFITKYSKRKNRIIMASSFGSISAIKAVLPTFDFNKSIQNREKIYNGLGDFRKQNFYRKYEIATFLPDLLMRQDKMSMAHSIENRVPFLDNNFVSTGLSFNQQHLLKKHKGKLETKYVLKQLAENIFGEKFAFRKKMGFGIPLKEFMSSESFHNLWYNKVKPGILKRKLFEINAIQHWITNIKTAEPDRLDAIWQMITFELWAQQYLD